MTVDTVAFIVRCVVALAIIFFIIRGLWLDSRKKIYYDVETVGLRDSEMITKKVE